jgi:acetolactate synthase I/II/III large subunit
MNIKSINKTTNSSQALGTKTNLSPNQISFDSSGSSIFSPPSLNEKSSESELSQPTVAEALIEILENLGVEYGFGVSGGGIGPLWATLNRSNIELLHFRHESGAAFAATEAYFASDRPVVVFTTTGPGITNALTGLFAARGEGAKVIFLSAATSTANRGRGACQETSAHTMPFSGIFTSGPLFNYATILESGDQLPEISRRLAQGLAQPGSFVAHISVPTPIQTTPLKAQLPQQGFSQSVPTASEEAIAECVKLLSEESFAIWVGFGARHAAEEIRQLAEKTGAAVMTSPRAKGIFPEHHPQFIGVTGFSGHLSVLTYMQEQRPQRILVLGTRLGEPTSFWSPVMIPSNGFIHVDIDPQVPGVAYPSVETVAVHSEIEAFLKAILKHLPDRLNWFPNSSLPRPEIYTNSPRTNGLVRPEVLMDAIQRLIIEGSDASILAEAGNSFAWATHLLRFKQPGRYRISTGFGSMGHATTGVVGTAVRFEVPSVWIILNDGRYNMCAQGMALQGLSGEVPIDTEIPSTDFAAIARAMGADGICVNTESDLEAALQKALSSTTPFIVDVKIDPTRPAPIGGRIQSLIKQGAIEAKTVIGH